MPLGDRPPAPTDWLTEPLLAGTDPALHQVHQDFPGKWEMNFRSNSTPLDALLIEIARGLDAQLYYLALMLALSVPDICVTLASGGAKSGPALYEKWVDRYFAHRLPRMTGKLLYKLRCGVSHNAKLSHKDLQYSGFDRVVFLLPGTSALFSGCSFGARDGQRAFGTDLGEFCMKMIEAARAWHIEHQADPVVLANMDSLVRYRSRGDVPGFLNFGVPVIA